MIFTSKKVDFKAWDEAIASRLAPIRTALGTIPVAALPKEAGKFGEIQFESIDWLFPSYQGSREENHRYRSQLITVTLVIRLYFQSRYPTGEERNTLEWCELQVLKLLTGYRLPDSNLPLALESGKLFAPTQGQWYKEIEFSFQSRLVGEDAIAPPPVQTIGIDDTIGQLIEVSS